MKKTLRIALAVVALLTGMSQRALAQHMYYWAASGGGDWNNRLNWRVFTPSAPATTPLPLTALPPAIPDAPPTANDDVIISNLASFGPGNVNITVGVAGSLPDGYPTAAAAKSISFEGTIPNNTNINFTVNQPLTVGTQPADGNVTAAYKVAIKADGRLTLTGSMTFGAANSSLVVNRPTSIAGAVTVNALSTITASSAFSANSLTFGPGAGSSTLTVNNQHTATIVNALTVNSAATIASNGTLKAKTLAVNAAAASIVANDTLQIDEAVTVGAAATVTVGAAANITAAYNGILQAGSVSFTASGATLVSNGKVSITNAVNVSAPTTITVNKAFSAGSLSFANTAGSSTFTVGRSAVAATPTTPAVTAITGASASIAGAVSVRSAATIRTHPANSLAVGGELKIETQNAVFDIRGAVTLGGSLSLAAAANLTSTGTAGSVIFTSTAADTKIKSSGAIFNVPVTFGVATTGTTRGRWTLQDNMRVTRRVAFVNGHVVALPVPPAVDGQPPYTPNATAIPDPKFIVELSTANNMGINTTTRTQVAITDASSASHVIGHVQLVNTVSATLPSSTTLPPFFLPTGDGKIYRPIGLAGFSNGGGGGTPYIIARYYNNNRRTDSQFKADPAPGFTLETAIQANSALNSVSTDEYWWLGRAGGAASPKVTLNAFHPDPLVRTHYRLDRRSGLTIAGLHDTSPRTWSEFRGTTPEPGWNISAVDAVNQNRAWYTIARRGSTPLPVRLVSFSAHQLDGQVQLKWQSASEENTSHFEVERSADGKQFAPLLTKKAQGNSAALVSYNATDNGPLSGTSYYRLKMVDLDGTFQYSNLVSVSNQGTVLVRAYPNPSNGREVQFLALNGDKLVLQSVMDAFGKPANYEAHPVYGQGLYVNFYGTLPAGFYVATLVTDDDKRERVRIKFIVQ